MVTRDLFARWGIVRFVRGWLRRRRFVAALEDCEAASRRGRTHIVVCYDGEPFIITKAQFKELRRRGVFRETSTWGALCRRRITRENLDSFFLTSNSAK